MNYINHITLNSGHIRKTYPNEVDKSLFFVLKRIYKESLTEKGAGLFENYIVKGTSFNGGAILTVFNGSLPILTTAVSKFKNEEVWRSLHETSTTPLKTKSNTQADAPFIADRLEIGAMSDFDALRWTGDFSRCVGWIVLDPNQIKKQRMK